MKESVSASESVFEFTIGNPYQMVLNEVTKESNENDTKNTSNSGCLFQYLNYDQWHDLYLNVTCSDFKILQEYKNSDQVVYVDMDSKVKYGFLIKDLISTFVDSQDPNNSLTLMKTGEPLPLHLIFPKQSYQSIEQHEIYEFRINGHPGHSINLHRINDIKNPLNPIQYAVSLKLSDSAEDLDVCKEIFYLASPQSYWKKNAKDSYCQRQ